jgi:hypothetical protein
MSTEPQYILNNFSDLDIIDYQAPAYYAQAAFGLTNSYLLNVNFNSFLDLLHR